MKGSGKALSRALTTVHLSLRGGGCMYAPEGHALLYGCSACHRPPSGWRIHTVHATYGTLRRNPMATSSLPQHAASPPTAATAQAPNRMYASPCRCRTCIRPLACACRDRSPSPCSLLTNKKSFMLSFLILDSCTTSRSGSQQGARQQLHAGG